MKTVPSFNELVQKDIIGDPDWASFIAGKSPIPDKHRKVLKLIAQYLFYMGDINHAREVSYKASIYWEKQATSALLETYSVNSLFDSALYRSLAHQKNDAVQLWQTLVEKRRHISEVQLLEQRMAHLWVYEAYALEKLKRYDEVPVLAKMGLNAINKGMATYRIPHQNSRVYGLVDVLLNLANYQIQRNSELQKQTQEALMNYKNENRKYGRLGYDIIFDLQFSYPDIFKPVLPGSDPEQD